MQGLVKYRHVMQIVHVMLFFANDFFVNVRWTMVAGNQRVLAGIGCTRAIFGRLKKKNFPLS